MIQSLKSVTNDSKLPEPYDESESNDEPKSDDEPEYTLKNPVCVVWLQERSQTWIFSLVGMLIDVEHAMKQ